MKLGTSLNLSKVDGPIFLPVIYKIWIAFQASKSSHSKLPILQIMVSIDCPTILNFATTLNLHLIRPDVFSQLSADCCFSPFYTTCINGRVTTLSLIYLNLNGTWNASAIPPSITSLNVGASLITGELTTYANLNSFQIWQNDISGNLSSIPDGMIYFDVGGNKMNGSYPTFPDSLQVGSFYANSFFGQFPDSFPPNMRTLSAERLYGTVPYCIPSTLTGLYLTNYYNLALTGDLSGLSHWVATLQISTTLSSPFKMTGRLVLYKPQKIAISGQYISDLVVYDTSALTSCDISFTPLLNNPNIVNLTMCNKNGIYSRTTTLVTTTSTATSCPTPTIAKVSSTLVVTTKAHTTRTAPHTLPHLTPLVTDTTTTNLVVFTIPDSVKWATSTMATVPTSVALPVTDNLPVTLVLVLVLMFCITLALVMGLWIACKCKTARRKKREASIASTARSNVKHRRDK